MEGRREGTKRGEVRWEWEGGKGGGGGRLVMRTVEEVRGGQELVHSYGAKSNRRWLLHYGMVPPHNPHHTVDLFLPLPPPTTLPPPKLALLAHLPLELSASASSACSMLALAALRVVHATPVEVGGGGVGRRGRGGWGEGNEGSVVGWLAVSARVELGRLGGEGEEEVEEAKVRRGRRKRKGKGGRKGEGVEEGRLKREREWMALVYRVGERRVWRWWAELDERVKQRTRRWRRQQGEEQEEGSRRGDADEREVPDREVDAYWTRVWLPMLQAQRDAVRV